MRRATLAKDLATVAGTVAGVSGADVVAGRRTVTANVELLAVGPSHLRALREVLAAAGASDQRTERDPAGLVSRVSTLADGLRAGQADGDFGAFDPAVMALAVTGAIDALVAVPLGDPAEVQARARELADVFDRATAPLLVGDPR